jgi:hypothetical protein
MARFLTLSLLAMVWTSEVAAEELPPPYLDWENAYLREFPETRQVMDWMLRATTKQLKDPSQDILHNRVCAALAYHMAAEEKATAAVLKLSVVTDLLHNVAKEDKAAVLTDSAQRETLLSMVARLRKAGYMTRSPRFLAEDASLRDPKVGGNLALIHHMTGAIAGGRALRELGGYSAAEIEQVEDAILAHSTGYWYFRASVDEAARRKGAWEVVYPEPEGAIAKYAHDADLISQFVPESVIPDGSKWRQLAQKRWGATTVREEGHVVYYVFDRLLGEARTVPGKALATEKWLVIRPALVKLMGLDPEEDPIKRLGVPKAFRGAS